MTALDEHVDEDVRFSETIKAASSQVHDLAERSPFVRRLLGGEAPIEDYAKLVAQHYFVYTALEAAGESMASDPIAGPFVVPELTRRPALCADLEALLGADWESQIAPLPATDEYVERIEAVASDSAGFVAHHYVRYLGDLSGGQIIRRILQRTYNLEGTTGVSFYVFDQLDNGVQFKKHYRDLLDTAAWSPAERQRVVDEVIVAFELNSKVFEQLDRAD